MARFKPDSLRTLLVALFSHFNAEEGAAQNVGRMAFEDVANAARDFGAIWVAPFRAPRMHSPWLAGVNASHPSQERFGVEEATVSELVDFFQNENTCTIEPGGKPCDHCAMCSSRGF